MPSHPAGKARLEARIGMRRNASRWDTGSEHPFRRLRSVGTRPELSFLHTKSRHRRLPGLASDFTYHFVPRPTRATIAATASWNIASVSRPVFVLRRDT